MPEDEAQTVLLSLVGTTPAVLTETVWALAHQSELVVPDRIVAVTTRTGREILTKRLFDDGHWDALKKELKRRGLPVDEKLRFGIISDSIRVFSNAARDRELDDIRTLEDNQAVAEFLMELVRGFTENDSVRLIVSIAGGRKTTSALLHSVMTLLGRGQDLITHIMVNDPWSYNPEFLYPGCKGTFKHPETGEPLNSSDAKLDLAEVPFVPLRYLFKRDLQRSAGSYLQLIQQLRNRALNVEDELTVESNTDLGEVKVNERVIRPSPNEFLLYLFFAERAVRNQPPVESYSCVGDELVRLKNSYESAAELNHWARRALQGSFDASEDPRKWAASVRTQFKKAGFDSVQIQRLVPRRGHLAIELPPEHIEILIN